MVRPKIKFSGYGMFPGSRHILPDNGREPTA